MTQGKQISRTEYVTPKPNATLVTHVQKEEWINTFLIEITSNPKITNNELAEKYHCHRNVVSKYRKIIRERQLRTNLELVNKIDNVLEDRLSEMENRDLISYRKAVTPQEVKMDSLQKGALTILVSPKLLVKENDATTADPPI